MVAIIPEIGEITQVTDYSELCKRKSHEEQHLVSQAVEIVHILGESLHKIFHKIREKVG